MDRTFSRVFNHNKGQPNFNYIFDENLVITTDHGQIITGNWRPMQESDFQLSESTAGISAYVRHAKTPHFGVKTFTDSAVQVLNSNDDGYLLIKAHLTNSGIAYVGLSGVNADSGYPLGSSEELKVELSDMSLIYVSGVSGDKVSYHGATRNFEYLQDDIGNFIVDVSGNPIEI